MRVRVIGNASASMKAAMKAFAAGDDGGPSTAASWAIVVVAMAVVLWVRLLPLSLPALDRYADLIVQRRADRQMDRAAATHHLKSQWTYTGADGREHVYLGDYDSYLWLRHARTYLRTGTACDAVVDGVCRDTYTNAPVGAESTYARSLHVAAIAGLHALISRVTPDHPLPSTAYLVPVIVGVLGVPPAFFIARSLSGVVGGLFAVALSALHPLILERTIGSDNDIWNMVLPLYMIWAIMGALTAAGALRQGLLAVLAGVCVGLQAWAWRGWTFSYTVVLVGLVGALLLYAARHAMRHRTYRIWQSSGVRRVVLVAAVFYVVAGVAATAAKSEVSPTTIAVRSVAHVARAMLGARRWTAPVANPDTWANVMSTVSELVPLRMSGTAMGAGGLFFFVGGLLGLVMLILPGNRWDWRHWGVLVTGAGLYTYCIMATDRFTSRTVALLLAPLVVALLLRWRDRGGPDTGREGPIVLLIAWFLAALYAAHEAARLMLLLAPPLGIACGIAIDRLCDRARRLLDDTAPSLQIAGYLVLGSAVVLVLQHPVRSGYTAAREYIPMMNDSWWGALSRIRDTSPPDAVVNTWWDYGHWVTYVGERRVSNDGTSLLTHVPHWVARALVAPTERESIGVLRMLDCGSDAVPTPEGRQGAFGKIRRTHRDTATVYGIVADLIVRDEKAADAYLAERGFAPAERTDILRSTHCTPPEAYLVLSTAMMRKTRAWMSLGLWRPGQGRLPTPRQIVAADDPTIELAPGVAAARAEAPLRFVPRWLPCRAARGRAGLTCPMSQRIVMGPDIVQGFVYDPASPGEGKLQIRRREDGQLGPLSEEAPAVIVVAGAERSQVVASPSSRHPDVGILVDVSHDRILVGLPHLMRSTVVHLLYLDGRYATQYRKVDERSFATETVVTWKIDWKGK